MPDVRRFDSLEKTVSDLSRQVADLRSTLLGRVGSHAHDGLLPGKMAWDIVATAQTSTNGAYGSLATVGPTVPVTVSAPCAAVVLVSCSIAANVAGSRGFMSFTSSGATTMAASDARALITLCSTANLLSRASEASTVFLAAGTTTFTAAYKTGSNTLTFSDRRLIVIPFAP